MNKRIVPVSFIFLMVFNLFSFRVIGQFWGPEKNIDKGDTLRGTLSTERSCFDVVYYHLDLRIDTTAKSINGYNEVLFSVVNETKRIQLDLFSTMDVRKIVLDDSLETPFNRQYNAIFIDFNYPLKGKSLHRLTVFYSGVPTIGKMLPWDGGFKWTHDQQGNAWIGVACQGTGASLWWPNKDHQSDEPDSMLISISVPSGLTEVSNGRLRDKKELRGGYTRYDWFVSYPINNYNVTVNIGNYAHFSDFHLHGKDTLNLDYYVLSYNLEKAQKQFEQVKSMLNCFEKYFGRYPFYRDGYKLVETPYLGMEHQSCIAYGNKYKTGYSGMDNSGVGVNFDYIIIHESAHEWWGNAITTKDIADMWVHEGFATYAEVLYTECMFDSAKAMGYAIHQMRRIGNDKPVIGPYGINKEGSDDMYSKGMALLHTIRHIINNDSLFFAILKGLQDEFRYTTVTSSQVENYISSKAGLDLKPVFDQYLRTTRVPVLELSMDGNNENNIQYRWNQVTNGFEMPLWICIKPDVKVKIKPGKDWQSIRLDQPVKETIKDLEDFYYIRVEQK